MREIKFRGRRAELPIGFVYGYFVLVNNDIHYIVNNDGWHLIIAKTQGQYTGLKDKNGKEIYEGDIIRWWWGSKHSWGPSDFVRFGTLYGQNDKRCTGWVVGDCFVDSKCTVIGNIHENPELLEGQNDNA